MALDYEPDDINSEEADYIFRKTAEKIFPIYNGFSKIENWLVLIAGPEYASKAADTDSLLNILKRTLKNKKSSNCRNS